MPGNVETIWISAEAPRVVINPRNSATDLVGHRHETAAGVLDLDKVEHDVVCASVDKHFGGKSKLLCRAVSPCAAMDIDHNRRFSPRGSIDVELLDIGRSIGKSKRRSQALQRRFTSESAPFADMLLIGCVDALVVGVIELFLIH